MTIDRQHRLLLSQLYIMIKHQETSATTTLSSIMGTHNEVDPFLCDLIKATYYIKYRSLPSDGGKINY